MHCCATGKSLRCRLPEQQRWKGANGPTSSEVRHLQPLTALAFMQRAGPLTPAQLEEASAVRVRGRPLF
eukprot:12884824-Prorocentrum_lima.AAC.1